MYKRPLCRRASILGLAAVVMSLLSACGNGAGPQPVRLTFWAWVPGMDKAVGLFNRTHKDIQVTLDNIPPGNRGGYAEMHAAVMSGEALAWPRWSSRSCPPSC